MRLFRITMLGVLACLLAACAATPAGPPMRIDEVTFVSGSGPGADALVLGVNRLYTLKRIAPPASGRAEVRTGSWRTVLAEQQLVLLDGQSLLRLIHNESVAENWRFVPITLVATAAIREGQKDNYLYLFDRWYVAKADLVREQGEDAAPGSLLLTVKSR